jgi:ferredoxin
VARITNDDSLCQGTAECMNIAPGLIELDGLGIATVVDPDAELSEEVAAKLVATCPSQAISLG